jgi:hypothetical protein
MCLGIHTDNFILNTNIFESNKYLGSIIADNISDNGINNIFVRNIFDEEIIAEDISVLSLSENNNSDTIKYISLSDFMYADTRMYILSGGLPRVETKLKTIPTAILSAALVGIFYLQHDLQMKTIWQNNEKGYFKFQDDLKEELFIDKCGHFYGTYISAYFLREALVASGFG